MNREVLLPDGHLDLLGGRVHRGAGSPTRLTPTEVAALSVLAAQAPDPVSEEELLRLAWGYRTTSTRTVSVTMSRIRQKIEADPRSPAVLLTVRGKGYRLVPFERASAPVPPERRPTPEPTHLVARDAERTAIQDALTAGVRVLQLVGAGGIGKSTLARAAVAGHSAGWVPVDDVHGEAGLIRRLADALDVEGDRSAVLQAIDRVRILVLDGAESLDSDALGVLSEGIRQTSTTLLLTTRHPLDLPGLTDSTRTTPLQRHVLLGPLGREAAIQVVQQQRRDSGLSEVPEEHLNPLLDAFGGHPLALAVAAPVLDFEPDPHMVLGLTEESGRDDRSLQTVLERTLAGLPEASRDLLATLSTFAVPPRATLVGERTGHPLPTVLRELHELRTRGLVGLDHGRVAVHGFVRQVARTDTALTEHVRWVATYPQDPGVLRPIRHELEQILPLAEGDLLAEALFRHLLVLHAFGPTDRLVADITSGTTRLAGHRAVPVLEGAALVVANEGEAALARLDRGLDALPDDDLVWRARALIYLDFAAGQARDPQRGREIRRTIDALRPRVPDAPLRHFMTIPAAVVLSRELAEADDPRDIERRIDAMLREVEAEANVQVALIAAIHRMLLLSTTPVEVRALENRLKTVGRDALGPTGWARRWLDVAHLHLLVGHPEDADTLLTQHAPDAMVHDPGNAGTIAICIAHVLDRPELAERWLQWIGRDHPAWARTRWLLDRPDGDPPFDDPALVALLEAWRDGAPLPPSRRWFHLQRALSRD